MRCAVIDIGTNTVKLLVADVTGNQITPVVSKDKTTRLGEGMVAQASRLRSSLTAATGTVAPLLSAAAIRRTVEAVTGYVAEARQLGATEIRALTTSAVRDAANRQEFLAACPLPVEVITGEREAELIYRGVASDPVWAGQPLLVLDVGGGSAELVQGSDGRVERWTSLPLGAVRLLEQFGDDIAGLMAHLRRMLAPVIQPVECQFIGTGGTITTLAKIVAQASRLCGADPVNRRDACSTLTDEDLRAWVSRLHALPLAERQKVPGLPPERADIIVPGGLVFVVAMELLGAREIAVSTRNLRYGALLERS
jgi:exopolyphosphatase/guanosine-5'-triphosphate,3'-diphosphate pyrophosphatase